MKFRSLRQFQARLIQADQQRRLVTWYSLERIVQAVDRLHHPEQRYRVVHVAGTSGKGSTCQLLAAILSAAGYRTGLYTSPHLVRFNERIKLNNRCITDTALLQLIHELWPIVADLHLSYFEWSTVLAFVYFAKRQVDYAVIEVGMGGRLDATNVVTPTVALVTEIDLDHTEHLGRTRRTIAREKAAIIKPGCIGLTGSRYVRRGRFVNLDNYQIVSSSLTGTVFHYGPYRRLQLGLVGSYQVRNAIMAIAAAQALALPERAIRRGLSTARIAGRFEILRRRPLIIADGAHNPHKMAAFVQSLRLATSAQQFRQTIALVSIKYTKDITQTLRPLLPLVDCVIITAFTESASLQKIRTVAKQLRPHLEVIIQPQAYLAYSLLRRRLQSHDLGIVTGSLYLIGDLKKQLYL